MEGADVAPDVAAKVESLYLATRHKRAVSVSPLDDWWRAVSPSPTAVSHLFAASRGSSA